MKLVERLHGVNLENPDQREYEYLVASYAHKPWTDIKEALESHPETNQAHQVFSSLAELVPPSEKYVDPYNEVDTIALELTDVDDEQLLGFRRFGRQLVNNWLTP